MREAKGCFASVRWGLVKKEKGKAAVCSPLVQHYCIRRTTCVPALSEKCSLWDLTKMLLSFPISCLLPLLLSQLDCLQTAVWGKDSFVFIMWERFLTVPWIEDSFAQRRICSTHWRHSLPRVWWQSLRPRQEKLSEVKFPILKFSYGAACEKNSFFLFRHLFLPPSLSFPCFLFIHWPLTGH